MRFIGIFFNTSPVLTNRESTKFSPNQIKNCTSTNARQEILPLKTEANPSTAEFTATTLCNRLGYFRKVEENIYLYRLKPR
jgi:hypothetical protein